jgi:hypothetical protein
MIAMLNFKKSISMKNKNIEKGQSLVEMTFGMIVLLMIVAGVLDIGRAYFTSVALEDAAGEAALYMSAYPDCPYDAVVGGVPSPSATTADGDADDTICEAPANAVWRAINAGGSTGMVDFSAATFTIKCFGHDNLQSSPTYLNMTTEIPCASAGQNDFTQVTVVYEFALLSPFIPEINNNIHTFQLRGTATEIITAP